MTRRLADLLTSLSEAARAQVQRHVPQMLDRRGLARHGPDRRTGIESVVGLRDGPTVLPSTGTLQRILKDYGLSTVIDDDGDLAVRWEKFSVYFFHYGQDEEVLQARLYLNRRFDVDLRPTLALVLDDWNRSKLFPKAYTVLPDDGLVGICAEQAFDFEGGTSREQLKFTIGMWLQNLQQFADWTEEHV